MNMIMEAENIKQSQIAGTFGSKGTMFTGNTLSPGSEASKGTMFPGETCFSKQSSSDVKIVGITDETFIVNQIEKYLCFNENVFGVSFKSILENITQYNLQKDEYDIKRDEEIQFLREEIARLKYLLSEN